MRRFKTIIAGVATTALLAGAAISASHSDAIKARQDNMKARGANLGILGRMAQGQIDYDSVKAGEAAAALVALLSVDQSTFWPVGSAQGMVEGTRAKAEIWDNFADVGAMAGDLAAAADALSEVAAIDLASLQGAIGAVGGACGVCHKAYRGPKN